MARVIPKAKVRALVRLRSGGRCEARVTCEGARAVLMHHRKRRPHLERHGETVQALCHLCEACHSWTHSNVAKSYILGLLVHSWDDPAEVPVVTPDGPVGSLLTFPHPRIERTP